MKRLALLLLLVPALVAPFGFAQEAASKKSASQTGPKAEEWKQEPDSFMGFKLGQPLAVQVEECPLDPVLLKMGVKTYGYIQIGQLRTPCFTKLRENLRIHNAPSIGVGLSLIDPLIVDGNLEGMTFTFAHSDFDKLLALL